MNPSRAGRPAGTEQARMPALSMVEGKCSKTRGQMKPAHPTQLCALQHYSLSPGDEIPRHIPPVAYANYAEID